MSTTIILMCIGFFLHGFYLGILFYKEYWDKDKYSETISRLNLENKKLRDLVGAMYTATNENPLNVEQNEYLKEIINKLNWEKFDESQNWICF